MSLFKVLGILVALYTIDAVRRGEVYANPVCAAGPYPGTTLRSFLGWES
jgi:hypothetical protein